MPLTRRILVSIAGLALVSGLGTFAAESVEAQEARRRWERACQIRQEKFERVLPAAMRDNDIDMWIVVMRATTRSWRRGRPPS